jgi:hypothetical protein
MICSNVVSRKNYLTTAEKQTRWGFEGVCGNVVRKLRV